MLPHRGCKTDTQPQKVGDAVAVRRPGRCLRELGQFADDSLQRWRAFGDRSDLHVDATVDDFDRIALQAQARIGGATAGVEVVLPAVPRADEVQFGL